ncbi:MAG: clan AA aspartic protease [Candidatus Kapabacteria bacterium]|nr:clan AA aspartic protease [Candidatus Kapabacteria bacterium]
MEHIRTTIILNNPTKQSLLPIEQTTLVDTGTLHLCIPEHVALQLELQELEQREVLLADGKRRRVPYCGLIEVRFKNRRCFVGALVLGNECLLGAIPMEDMDLVVHPARLTVDVNPLSPNIAVSLAK